MRCKNVKDYLERYADGTLEMALQTGIKEHLSSCSVCGSLFNEIGTLRALLKESAHPPLLEHSVENIMAAARHSFLNKRQDENESLSFRWWTEATLSARAVFTGILIAIVAAGGFIGKDLWRDPKPLSYSDDPALEAFSASQKGSLEYFYMTMTVSPLQGVKK